MIKDDKIYWNETEEWVDTDSVLQEITDMAADVTKKSMSMKILINGLERLLNISQHTMVNLLS